MLQQPRKEGSQLRRPLPPCIRDALMEREITEDQVVIATDTDLDIAGEYGESWLVLTNTHVLIFIIDRDEHEAILAKNIPLSGITSARTDSRVGSGFLEIKTNGEYEEQLRFSNRNAEKFAKVAAQIRSMAHGKVLELKSTEDEEDEFTKLLNVKKGMVFVRFLKQTQSYWPYTVAAMVLVVLTILMQLVPAQLTRVLVDTVILKKEMPLWFEGLAHVFGLVTPAQIAAETGVDREEVWSLIVVPGTEHLSPAEAQAPPAGAAPVSGEVQERIVSVMRQGRVQWLYLLVFALTVTTAAASIVAWLRERLAVWIANRLAFDLRQKVFQKLEDMAVRYHDEHPVGQLMTRASQDIEALQGFINQLTSGFGYEFLLVVSVAVVMFVMNWQLALIACLPAPLVMLSTVWFYRVIVPRWQKYWHTRSSLANALHGALSGIRVVKAFAQEQREAERFEKRSANLRDAGFGVGYSAALFYPLMGFVFQLGGFFVWMYGGLTIINAEAAPAAASFSVGALLAFLGYLGMFYAPLNSLTQMSSWFTQFTTQAHRVFEVLDERPEIIETADAVDIEIQGAVRFNNVSFGYDPHIPVLHEVSFDVRPGEMIGVVGHSGSGKSTTVSLMMRFYDVKDGNITIDNIDIQKIRKNCLRRQVGIVAQDPFLFVGTVADNIAYGNPRVAPELVLDAALSANAHIFITRMHDGYDTRLGERGAGLSGGERQRVAIARALLHNPRILILDEATSSVDTISEREIQRALEALSLGRTTIAIAHRLTTLRNCDRILVFEEGRIREQGSHDELYDLGGIYRKLVDIQTELTTGTEDVDGLRHLSETEGGNGRDRKERPTYERARHVPRIQYLDPAELRIFSRDEGGMLVEYKGQTYNHVRAYRCFPISRPQEFIALWIGRSALEHKEIGMVRRLKELQHSSRMAVELELGKRYFIHYIHRINGIKEDLGFLTWDVETNKGPMEFITKRWERGTVVEGGHNARIIFDVHDNRYEIENLETIDPQSRGIYEKYIFW